MLAYQDIQRLVNRPLIIFNNNPVHTITESNIFDPVKTVIAIADERPFEEDEVSVLTQHTTPYTLIVWNDEVNTFEWVIETLIDVCGHSQEQAEQCAMLIHTKGKYAVKNGDYDTLKPMCDAITERGIGATIEMIVDN